MRTGCDDSPAIHDDDAIDATHGREAMGDEGRILVMDPVIPLGNDSNSQKIADIHMMVTLGGMERTEPEFKALFEAANFHLTNVIHAASRDIIEGVPV